MNTSHRPLLLRSNRFLGSSLIDRDLISSEVLETANEKLLEAMQSGDGQAASLLHVLLMDMNALNEADMIENIVETEGIGAIDLEHYDLSKAVEMEFDLDLCAATYTVPFDQVEDLTMLATAYYLSRPAMKYWQEQFPGPVVWYVCTAKNIFEALERIRSDKEKAAKEAAEAPAKSS